MGSTWKNWFKLFKYNSKIGKSNLRVFGDLFTDLFHGIYKQQIEPQKAKRVIIAIASVAVVATLAFSGINYLSNDNVVKKPED